MNPYLLYFYAHAERAATHGENVGYALEHTLGVPDAVQYSTFEEFSLLLKALGFALAARVAVAGVIHLRPELLSKLFQAMEEEEEEDDAPARAPIGDDAPPPPQNRKKHILDDFHSDVRRCHLRGLWKLLSFRSPPPPCAARRGCHGC